jgi:ABC-2 type transport system ATP-binding protein
MKKILSLQNVSYSIPFAETILKDISFEISEGEFIGLLGHNGAGKTTLMDLFLGLRKCTSGKLEVLGRNPHLMERDLRIQVVYLSQDNVLKSNITIAQFLEFHSSFYPTYSREEEKHLLEVFSLNPEMKIGALSTGQQKKVQVVANLSALPRLILIDEITAVMDPETRAIFFQELQRIRTVHKSTIILATNIAEDLISRADRVVFISNRHSHIHGPDEIDQLFNLFKDVA